MRPGLIVGPGDPSGRFSYWPERIAEGGDILAPGSPEDDTQLIDVRDLAAWLVDGAEQRLTGVYDATGRVTSIGEVLEEVTVGVGGDPHLFWAHPAFLRRHHVQPWSGPAVAAAVAARGDVRAWSATTSARPSTRACARDRCRRRPRTRSAWIRSEGGRATVTGMTRAEEQDLLDDWHTIRA